MTATIKDNIIYSGEVPCNITTNFKSLGHLLLERIKNNENDVMMINGLTGVHCTRKEIYIRTVRLAYALRNLGVKSGDVVGLCSENCFEFAVTLFAIIILDATAAPFNVQYTERELNHAVNLSKPKILFGSKTSLDNVLAVAKKNKFVTQVFVFGDVSPSSAATPLTRLLNDEKIGSNPDFDSPTVDKKETVSLIMCSSGTTGMPKGVQLTQQNILYILNERLVRNRILGSVLLSVIPWTHSFGCMTLMVSSCLDIQSIFLTKFEEKAFLQTIEKYKVTTAYMVPPLMVFLAKHPLVDKYDLSSLQRLACGAAPLSREVEDAIRQRIKIPSIRQGYGLTETTVGILSQNDRLFKPGSVGGVTSGLWAKVIDTETGVPLGPNQCGELCFKGDCVMKGYIGDRSATATIIKDGWLHTGDIGYFDEDLEFFVVDRIKELIKYKGFQVPPAEIEALLLTHPKIKDAAVIGLPDDTAGELPLAFVVKQANVELTAEEVTKFVANNASAAKKLRGGVRFLSEIPKNASGKILRRLLRDSVQPKSKL